MNILRKPLPLPRQKPQGYLCLKNEPIFNPAKHLQLEKPENYLTLRDFGYDEATCQSSPSQLAVTAPFRILSDEGMAIVYELCKQMENNKNDPTGTGVNRVSSYVRGVGYRSHFMHELWSCSEITNFISDLSGVPLGIHSVPAMACSINYAPKDLEKAVDNWHVDSVPFDIVILAVDPSTLKGGEFQYFKGTKEEGERILGVKAEEGAKTDLPHDRVVSQAFPAAGYGFLQQGNLVFHRACKLLEKTERITIIPCYNVLDSKKHDATNYSMMMKWSDQGLLTELARHEAWISVGKLENMIHEIDLEASKLEIAEQIDTALGRLNDYSAKLRQMEN